MHLLAHEPSLGDKVINAANAKNRSLEERMMTDCVKGVHSPEIRELLSPVTPVESASAAYIPAQTTPHA